MNEPTKEAMRAAQVVEHMVIYRKIRTRMHLARVIDEETNLPAMIAACRAVADSINGNEYARELARELARKAMKQP